MRATPRLLPHDPPPALAKGWLVPNNVMPATVVEPPMVFSPEASVIFQPLELSSCALASVTWLALHTLGSCRQSFVASNSPLGALDELKVASVTVAWPVASNPVLRSLIM